MSIEQPCSGNVEHEFVHVYNTPILLLVGGQGTRVKDITQDKIPKSLIKIENDLRVIDLVYDSLCKVGYNNFIFLLGRHGDMIKEHINKKMFPPLNQVKVSYFEHGKEVLLGTAEASCVTIEAMNLNGPVLLFPGDRLYPWNNLRQMIRSHTLSSADITFGTTSTATERTSNIGRVAAEKSSGKLIEYRLPGDPPITPTANLSVLTSAGVSLVDAQSFSSLCSTYHNATLEKRTNISIGDIVRFGMKNESYKIVSFDLAGEILDLGTIDRLEYARQNWQKYVP